MEHQCRCYAEGKCKNYFVLGLSRAEVSTEYVLRGVNQNSLLTIWDELNILTNSGPIYRKLDLAGGWIPYTKSLGFKITNLERKFFSLGY